MDLKIEPNLIQEYQGRKIRLSGTRRVSDDAWSNGAFRFKVEHDFIFLDTKEVITIYN